MTEYTKGPMYVGAQNDAIYLVVGRKPAMDNDFPNHAADRTPIAKVYNIDDAKRLEACRNALEGYNPFAVRDLVEAAKAMLPTGISLTNTNIPDRMNVPIEASMGELRALANALAQLEGGGN